MTAFSMEHLSTLYIILLLGVGLILFRQTSFARSKLRFWLAAILIIGETGYQIGTSLVGKWTLRNSLPLEVSDLSALLTAITLLTRKRPLAAILYFVGISSALQALLTPDLNASFPDLRYIQFFATHGATVLGCTYLIAVAGIRPTYRALWFAAAWLNGYAVLMFIVNRLLNANYMYLMHKPKLSALNLFGPWPWYLIWAELAMLIEFHLLYWINRKFSGRRRK